MSVCMWLPNIPSSLNETSGFFLHVLRMFVRISWLKICQLTSRFAILFYCSMYLNLCQYYVVWIATPLKCSLLGNKLLKMALTSQNIFVVLYKFQECLFQICEECHWYLNENYIDWFIFKILIIICMCVSGSVSLCSWVQCLWRSGEVIRCPVTTVTGSFSSHQVWLLGTKVSC